MPASRGRERYFIYAVNSLVNDASSHLGIIQNARVKHATRMAGMLIMPSTPVKRVLNRLPAVIPIMISRGDFNQYVTQ